MSKPTIRKVVFGVSMQLGHIGLAKLLKKHDLDLENLSNSDLIMCINGANDKMKVIGGKGLVIGYLRLAKGKIALEALQYIPRTFGQAGFNYDAAVKTMLESRMRLLSKAKPVGPLQTARHMRERLGDART